MEVAGAALGCGLCVAASLPFWTSSKAVFPTLSPDLGLPSLGNRVKALPPVPSALAGLQVSSLKFGEG